MKKLLAVLLILTLMLSVVGCNSGTNDKDASATPEKQEVAENKEEAPQKPTDEGYGTMMVATKNTVKLMNPHEYTSSHENTMISHSSGRLFRFFLGDDKESYVLEGEYADGEPIQVDEEGKVWQIKIKKDQKWANGDPINADDFIYTYKMILDPKLMNYRGASFAKNLVIVKAEDYYQQLAKEEIGEVKWEEVGIKKIDDYTIEIASEIKQTAWDIKYNFSFTLSSLVYEPLYEENMNEDRTETSYGTDVEKYMAAGAFSLESWTRDSELKYKKNPNYVKRDIVWLAGMHYKVVKDSGTQMQLFENGELDYIELSAEDYLKYEEDPRVLYQPSTTIRYLAINATNPENKILGNKNFRKALFFAMDRETLAALGKQTPTNYVVSARKIGDLTTGVKFRDTDIAKKNVTPNYGYDPELAVESFNKSLEEEGINKVSLTINYYETRDDVKQMSEYIQKALPELFGSDKIEIKLQSLPTNQLYEQMKGFKDNPSAYDISWAGWSGGEFAPWSSMKVYLSDYKRKNEPFYNEEFDALYNDVMTGEAKYDSKKRIEATAAMEKILLDDFALIPMYQPVSKYLKTERLELPGKKWVSGFAFGWRYARIKEE